MKQPSDDILLLEGLNQLNVELVPLAPAVFEYVSDIRQQSWEGSRGLGGLRFEVDIQNIGGAAGACRPIAAIEHSFSGSPDLVDMGEQIISPGETVAFSGEWSLLSRPGPDDWWRPQNIISEAGVITFDFGLSLKLISVSVEAVGDGTYWVTQVIRVPSDSAAFIPEITIAGVVASQAHMYPPEWLYTTTITITYSGEYEIRGVHSGMVYPGEADTRKIEPVALPEGIYDIVSSLRFGFVVGPDSIRGWMPGWKNVVVGQVEII